MKSHQSISIYDPPIGGHVQAMRYLGCLSKCLFDLACRQPTNICVARRADYTSAGSSTPDENIPLSF